MRRSVVISMVVLSLGASAAKAQPEWFDYADGLEHDVDVTGPGDGYAYSVNDSSGSPPAPSTFMVE